MRAILPKPPHTSQRRSSSTPVTWKRATISPCYWPVRERMTKQSHNCKARSNCSLAVKSSARNSMNSNDKSPAPVAEHSTLKDFAVVKFAEQFLVGRAVFWCRAAHPGDVHIVFQRNVFIRNVPAP